jgi:hypothetical protein
MNRLNTANVSSSSAAIHSKARKEKVRRAAYGGQSGVLTDIYRAETNIVIWQRKLSESLRDAVHTFLKSNPNFQASMTITPQCALSSLGDCFDDMAQSELSENIAELVDMFCCLFELRRVGLRLTALDRAMCPKFHVDNVPCRLITTFQGVATEWLPHQLVNRGKLGVGSLGKPDHESGVYQHQRDIQQLCCGDVALLKGELWQGNEGAGLVHRSPALSSGARRLLLTLDFSH